MRKETSFLINAVFFSCHLTGVVLDFLSHGNVGLCAALLILFQVQHCPDVLTGTRSAHQDVTFSVAPPLAYLASCLKWEKSVPAGRRWYNRMMNDQVNHSIIILFTVHLSGTAWFLRVLFHGMLDSHGVLTAAAPCVNQTPLLTLHIEQMEREQNTLYTSLLSFISPENTSHSNQHRHTGLHSNTDIQECKRIFWFV